MKVHCPHCDQRLEADASLYGEVVACPSCGESLLIPRAEFRYWAFISYSHQDNLMTRNDGRRDCVRWGEWLHQSLESYRIPEAFAGRKTIDGEPMPERFFPVFQDEKELPINADLGGSIRDALEQSRHLIVICSPRSAVSRYVNEEVRYFRQLGRSDSILAVIVDGEPNASLGVKAGVPTERECFCPSLRHPLGADGEEDFSSLLDEEPIAGDVRNKAQDPPHEATVRDLKRGHGAALEFAKLKLIAGMMGVGLDDLVQRDRVRHAQEMRRRRNRLLAISAIILGLLTAAGWFGYRAWEQEQLAERLRIETQEALEKSEAERMEKEKVKAEAAKSDREVALASAEAGQVSDALAYLARAMETFPPEATSAAEMAVAAMNGYGLFKPHRVWTGHSDPVKTVHFHPSGDRLVSAGGDAALLWELGKNEPVERIDSRGNVHEAWFHPEGDLLAVSTDQGVVLREMGGGRRVAVLSDTQQAAVRFSRDGGRLLTKLNFNDAKVWDGRSGAALTSGLGSELQGAQISPNGEWVGTADSQGRIGLHPLADGGSPISGGNSGPSGGVAFWIEFSPDSQSYVACVTGRTFIGETATGRTIHEFPESEYTTITSRFSPDGLWLVTGSEENQARVWSTINYRLVATLEGHSEPITEIDISWDGRRVLTASTDNTARLWDAASGELLQILEGHTGDVRMARFSPDGRHIATASDDRSVILWTLAPVPERLFAESTQGLPEFNAGPRWAPDGRRIAGISFDHQTASEWSLKDRKLEVTLKAGEAEPFGDIVLGSDSGLAVTLPENPQMPGLAPKLWNLASGGVLAILDPGDVAAFSPDGSRLFSGSSMHGPGAIWDAKRVRPWMNFDELTGSFGYLGLHRPIVFSRDGKHVVTREGEVWDVEAKRKIATLDLPLGEMLANLDFSPDGSLIAGSFSAGTATVRVWKVASGKLEMELNTLERSATLDWARTMSGQKSDSPMAAQHAEFSPDGKLLLAHSAPGGSLIWVWEVQSRERLSVLTGHRGDIRSAHFNPAGDRVISCGADLTLRLWNALDGRPMATLSVPSDLEGGVGYSLDGSRLIPTGRGTRYWEMLDTRKALPPAWFPDFLRLTAKKQVTESGQVEFVPSGRWVASRKSLEAEISDSADGGDPYLGLLRRWLE